MAHVLEGDINPVQHTLTGALRWRPVGPEVLMRMYRLSTCQG